MATKKKNALNPKDRYVAILAGGKGERFWPLSRESTPKQLLALFDKKSFLQHTFERVKALVPVKNIFIITNESQAAAIRKQLPRVPKDNVIAEPCGRDTCPAITLAAALVGARSTTGVMAVLPSDHVISAKGEKNKRLRAPIFSRKDGNSGHGFYKLVDILLELRQNLAKWPSCKNSD